MIENIIKPKSPPKKHWLKRGSLPSKLSNGSEGYIYYHKQGLNVISSLDVASDHPGEEDYPTWHVSISRTGPARASTNECNFVLKHFDMDGALEDNHVPGGVVRNFWLPVEEARRGVECPCVDSEPKIVEDRGEYVWRPAPEK